MFINISIQYSITCFKKDGNFYTYFSFFPLKRQIEKQIVTVTKCICKTLPYISAACTTLSSSKPEPCVFPFVYDGVEYNECTSVDAANPGNVWCATEVAPEYNNTVIDGRWGDCAESCPGASKFNGVYSIHKKF